MANEKQKYLFDREIYIFGIRRSGMHAIQNWIVRKFDKEDYIYQNDTHFTLRSGGRQCNFPDVQKSHYKLHMNVVEQEPLDTILDRYNNPISYLNLHKDKALEISKQKYFAQKCKFVLVLRNPFNNLASMLAANDRYLCNANLRAIEIYKVMIEDFRCRWMQYAREFIGITNYLPNKCCVLYDKWFTSTLYRLYLNRRLNISDEDIGYLDVANGPDSSSFDGDNYNGRADEMAVMERWKKYVQNDRYREILNSKELLDLYRLIFKEDPPFNIIS